MFTSQVIPNFNSGVTMLEAAANNLRALMRIQFSFCSHFLNTRVFYMTPAQGRKNFVIYLLKRPRATTGRPYGIFVSYP